MTKETELLPPSHSRESALFFVFAALCFLAVLSALIAKGTYGAVNTWTNQVEGEIVIQLVDVDRRTANDAIDIIEKVPGILDAEVMTIEEMKAQLREALNVSKLPDAVLPLPFVVRANGGANASDLASIAKTRLAEKGINAEVSAAADWVGDASRALGVVRVSALAAVVLLSLTGLAVIAFATHAALLAQRDTVNVLHLSGASDPFVANLFERRFWVLGLKSGSIGALTALGSTAFVIFAIGNSQRGGLLPELSLDRWDVGILIITPIVAGLAARLAARQTVMRTLAEAS